MSQVIRRQGDDNPAGHRRKHGSKTWRACVSVSTAVGLMGAIVSWGLMGSVALALCLSLLAALFAASLWGGDGRGAFGRMSTFAAGTGLAATAVPGLIALAGWLGLVLVVGLIATWPALWKLVRAWRLMRGVPWTDTETDTPRCDEATRRSLPSPTEAVLLPQDLDALDDAGLCMAWRRSFLVLQAARSRADVLAVVQLRQRYLDELQRRCPQGVARWLASGARAAGNPISYLESRPRRSL